MLKATSPGSYTTDGQNVNLQGILLKSTHTTNKNLKRIYNLVLPVCIVFLQISYHPVGGGQGRPPVNTVNTQEYQNQTTSAVMPVISLKMHNKNWVCVTAIRYQHMLSTIATYAANLRQNKGRFKHYGQYTNTTGNVCVHKNSKSRA